MNPTAYLMTTMVFHALVAIAFMLAPQHLQDGLGKSLFAYFLIMAVWAAGLLSLPVNT